MSTLIERLSIINDKLNDIVAKANAGDSSVKEVRQSVRDKGVSVTADTTLAELPDKIREIVDWTTTESSPVGEIIAYMGTKCPEHYLICDGTEYSIGSYPLLEKFFTDQFGKVNHFGGDGSATFAVPDLRGEFLRGTGENTHTNNGNGAGIGVHQDATSFMPTEMNFGSGVWVAANNGGEGRVANADTIVYGDGWRSVQTSTHESEYSMTRISTRPTNTSVLFCIKYEPTVVVADGGNGGNVIDTPLTEEDVDNIIEYIFAENVADDPVTDDDSAVIIAYIFAPEEEEPEGSNNIESEENVV